MIYITPSLFALFALTFGIISYQFATLRHLAFFAAAFALCGLGLTMQVVWWPAHSQANSVLATSAYLLGVQSLVAGVLLRSGQSLSWWGNAATFCALTVGSMYFLFIEPNVIARTYVLNLGLGLILLSGAWMIRSVAKGNSADRLLFWALVAVGLHFFPRTMLTAGSFVKGIEGYGQTTFWILLQYSMALIAAGGATILLIATGIDIASSLRAERDTDILTGLLNRRGFETRADEVAMDRRKPRAVIILDLDHFKWINDRFGHAEGDRVLREVGVILRASCRDDDVAVRLGGEEFAILVDGTSVTAAALADRLRQNIEEHHFASGTLDHNVTASFGVAEHKPGESIWDSVKRADTQLYKAKRAGRNVVRSDLADLEGVEVGEV